MGSSYTERFGSYFAREVAQKAAKSISDGAEMEFQTSGETFTFTKEGGKNAVKPTAARAPQLTFTLTPAAADAILADTSEDIGAIGVDIAKMVVAQDPSKKVRLSSMPDFFPFSAKAISVS